MTLSTGRPAVRRSRAGRLLAVVPAAAGVALAAVVLLPDLLGLERFGPVVQLVSFRPQLLAAAAVLTVLVLVGVLVRTRRTGWPPVLGPAVTALVAVLLAAAAMVAPRAVPDPAPTGGRPLTVLSFNVYEGQADVAAFTELIRAERPDLIAVPEAGSRFAARLAPLVAPLGYRLHATAAADPDDVSNVVAAASDRLGPVRVQVTDAAAGFPAVQVSGGALGELRFVAVHTQAPVDGRFARWRADLAGLAPWCAGPTPAVVAGDLNASLDHAALRAGMAGCTDAAAQRGAGLTPTWGPSADSRTFGPQIDHVLVTGGIAAQTFAVYDLPGSDHRAILTRLLLPGPG